MLKTNIFLFTIFALLILAVGCSKKELQKNDFVSDNSPAMQKNTAEDTLKSSNQKRIVTLKPSKKAAQQQNEYLKIKFQQNDTEVEMVLDPQSTNLNLDLVRGPEGFLEIQKGDSILLGKKSPDSEKDFDPLEATNLDAEDLTDEIIRDINLAQKMFYERKYTDALNVLKDSLEKKKTATAYALGGSIYYVSGDTKAAVNAWENALKINPDLDEVKELVSRFSEN